MLSYILSGTLRNGKNIYFFYCYQIFDFVFFLEGSASGENRCGSRRRGEAVPDDETRTRGIL